MSRPRHPLGAIPSPWSEDDLEEIEPSVSQTPWGTTRTLRRWRVKEGHFLAGQILTEVKVEAIPAEFVKVEPLPEPSGKIFYLDYRYDG